jgi:DNA invertase Pin-like site-specific DNA recombinase
VTELTVGYCRISTVDQDLTAQREALAACRRGDSLVVTKLDRPARSVPDARDIVDELTAVGVRLNIGGSVHGGMAVARAGGRTVPTATGTS